MKAGDYVRIKDYQDIQHIIKIEKIIDDYTIFFKKGYWSTENIIKSSPNIIDLIEVGDYVNGLKVDKKYEDRVVINTRDEIIVWFEYQIKSIVTCEMFESMEYKVGE